MGEREILAQNLGRLMSFAGVSQTQVSQTAQVDQTTIGRVLRCENDLQINKLGAIAAAFNLEAWQLLVPNLDPANPPIPICGKDRRHYERNHKFWPG